MRRNPGMTDEVIIEVYKSDMHSNENYVISKRERLSQRIKEQELYYYVENS